MARSSSPPRRISPSSLPFLGRIPLQMDVRDAAEAARPITGDTAAIFDDIARGIMITVGL